MEQCIENAFSINITQIASKHVTTNRLQMFKFAMCNCPEKVAYILYLIPVPQHVCIIPFSEMGVYWLLEEDQDSFTSGLLIQESCYVLLNFRIKSLLSNTCCFYLIILIMVQVRSASVGLIRFSFTFFPALMTSSFLTILAKGQQAYVMAWCPSCVCRCINFYFKHLLL